MLRACLLLCSVLLLGACSAMVRNPVPADLYQQTTVLGRQDLRVWGDRQDSRQTLGMSEADPEFMERKFSGVVNREHNYLVISGGGANGAYGAGVLVGWSTLGTRPEFTMVTGVSTGALTAPFAFLGSAYDDQLKLLYTTLDSSSIFFRRSIFSLIRSDAVADSAPLLEMLKKYVTDEMIAEIAREYRKGRILHIGTTNLDAGRPVIWNIGRIADSGDPGAGDLIRQVLLASASVPGVFPPAYIPVQSPDGETYDEMHVDGGTTTQMFLYPSRINFAELRKALNIQGTPRAFVIRNSLVQTIYDPVRARWSDIASRSVSSLIRNQGIGDAFRIAAIAQRDGISFQMTWIPLDAPRDPGRELFDPEYMSALFQFGYQRSVNGTAWAELKIDNLDLTIKN